MKLFVFEDVLEDYTSGMAVVIAKNLSSARQLCFDKFGYENKISTWLNKNEPGFKKPTQVIEVSETEIPRIVSFVYGGS